MNVSSQGGLRVLLAFGAFGLFWGTWGALIPDIQARTGADDGELGTAILMIGLGALGTMRVTGWLIDRHGGVVLPGAAVLFALCGVLPGLASTPLTLGAGLLLLGMSSGALDVAINAAGVAEEAAAHRPVMNLAHACFSAGVVVASLATGGLLAVGLEPPHVLLGVAGLLCVVALTVLRGTPIAASPAPARARGGARRRWPPGALLALGGLGAMAYLVENAWQNWGAVHLSTTLRASAPVASAAPAVFAVCAFTGRLMGHVLARSLSGPVLLAAGALLAAGGSALSALAHSTPLALLGIALAGLGTSVCAPTLVSLAGAWAGPHQRAGALSTVTTLAYLGFLVGPAAVGLVAARTRLSTALLGVAALAVLLALLIAPTVRLLHTPSEGGPRT